MGERNSVYRVLVREPEGKNHLIDQDVDGRMILRCIFKKLDVGARTSLSWLGIGTGGGHL